MKPFHRGPIDKRFAHKDRDENVFVSDLRRAVPGTLPKDTVETLILPRLDEAERSFFLEYYQPWVSPTGEPGYTLFNIPHQLPSELFDSKDKAESFTPSEQKTLLRSFVPNGENIYQLKGPISEMDEVVLTNILDQKGLSLSEADRTKLANLLEVIPDIPREDVYHAGFHFRPDHSFFFEHPNEHVPGMMILEGARQFAIACWHQFGKIPLKGYQFIMNELGATFHDYVDLHYPATFQAEARSLFKRPTDEWYEANLYVTLHQRGTICGEMQFPSQVLSKRSFQRLRGDRQKTDPLHRFHPIESIHHKLSLWDPEKGKYHKVKLWDISMEGFRVEFQDIVGEGVLPSSWEAILYFEDVGFIRSLCSQVWHQNDKEVHLAGFRFQGMNQEDRTLLQLAIRQYCYVRREREQL